MLSKKLRKPTDALRRVLADNIAQLRHSKRLSQEDLAEVRGLHRTYVG